MCACELDVCVSCMLDMWDTCRYWMCSDVDVRYACCVWVLDMGVRPLRVRSKGQVIVPKYRRVVPSR